MSGQSPIMGFGAHVLAMNSLCCDLQALGDNEVMPGRRLLYIRDYLSWVVLDSEVLQEGCGFSKSPCQISWLVVAESLSKVLRLCDCQRIVGFDEGSGLSL